MMILQTLLMLAVTLLLCSGARLPRLSSSDDDDDDYMSVLPNTDTCGQSGSRYVTRFHSGRQQAAKSEEFPWMATLGYVKKGSTTVKWGCRGSLITNQHVLTAAHCVHPDVSSPMNLNLVKIRLGDLNLNETVVDESEPQDMDVDTIIWHEQYSKGVNDIAIVKMKNKVLFTDFIRPICLPLWEEFVTKDFTGHYPQVLVWDSDSFAGLRETRLLVANVQIKDIDECRRNITSMNPNAIIDSRVICASAKGVSSCQGDSGGPLMIPRIVEASSSDYPYEPRRVQYFLMGITSYGHDCAKEGSPSIYVRVSTYLSWIVGHLDV